jgi:hypothetical protein
MALDDYRRDKQHHNCAEHHQHTGTDGKESPLTLNRCCAL